MADLLPCCLTEHGRNSQQSKDLFQHFSRLLYWGILHHKGNGIDTSTVSCQGIKEPNTFLSPSLQLQLHLQLHLAEFRIGYQFKIKRVKVYQIIKSQHRFYYSNEANIKIKDLTLASTTFFGDQFGLEKSD